RKILLTFLAGIASIAVSFVIFTATADRILLVLGGLIFAASLVLGSSLWRTAARGRYEVVEGICAGVSTPNALDLQQPLGMVLQNIQRFHTKPGNDLRGSCRPNAFDEAGGQIALHAALGLGNDLAPLFYLKLHTIFSLCPLAVQFQF